MLYVMPNDNTPVSRQRRSLTDYIASFIGPFATFAVLVLLQDNTDELFHNGSFGAAVTIIYAMKSDASIPSHVFLGQLTSGGWALLYKHWLSSSPQWVVTSLSVATAVCFMDICGIVHPPGGATAYIISTASSTSAQYLLFPLIVGNAILLTIAIVILNGVHARYMYPTRWW